MGYILITIGLALCGFGIYILMNSKTVEAVETQTVEIQPVQPEEPTQNTEIQPTPYEQGFAFEKFIVELFDTEYFTIEEWRGDKYHKGRYAESNRYPDLKLSLAAYGKKTPFAVECKWRSAFNGTGILWANDKQIAIYNKFAEEQQLDVFVVIGVGGTSDKPEAVYVVPLRALKHAYATEKYLDSFKRKDANGNFFYNPKNKTLR